METTVNGEFFRGHIDTIILKLLYAGDRYGYDIIKEIEQKSEGKYKIKQATLYSSLRRLEEQGFLTSYWGEKSGGGRKKYYTLTAMGKEVFVKNQTNWTKSKSIIDNLVYDKRASVEDFANDTAIPEIPPDFCDDSTTEFDENAESAWQSLEELTSNALEPDESQTDPFEENNFFGQVAITDQAQEELKDNFDRIFGRLNSQKSYVDSVVSQTYNPAPKPNNKALDFFDENERPFNEFITKPEEKEKDYKFLEPELQNEKQDEESPIKAKAKQILFEAKAASPSATPPSATKPEKTEVEFIKYKSDGSERVISDAEIISRDYQLALSRLVKNIKRNPQTEAINTRIQQEKKLEGVCDEAMNMGDSVTVRRHDNSVKQYNSENYFYKNRLMLVHYGILFVFMLIQTAIAFAVCELVLTNDPISTTDLWVYIGSVLIALFFPVYAFICSYKDYYKRKMREKTFKGSITFRIIILLQLWVIISAIAVYRGILTADIMNYLATFAVPAALSFNVIWSYIIHVCLLKSNKFSV